LTMMKILTRFRLTTTKINLFSPSHHTKPCHATSSSSNAPKRKRKVNLLPAT
jgi:hypothetical protein